MLPPLNPTIIFKGDNEFEAQMARDILTQAGVPVIHVPSLSTGVFGFRQTTRVAVPESFAEEAVAVLVEAGFQATRQEPPRGAGALQSMFQDALPFRLGRFMIVAWILGILVILLLILWSRSCGQS